MGILDGTLEKKDTAHACTRDEIKVEYTDSRPVCRWATRPLSSPGAAMFRRMTRFRTASAMFLPVSHKHGAAAGRHVFTGVP